MYLCFFVRHLNTSSLCDLPCMFVSRVKWWATVWAAAVVVDKDRILQHLLP